MAADSELEEEQEFLARAYEALEAMRSEATRMLESVLDLGRGGTFQSRTERDIVVRTSLARLAQLDVGDQALLFGRIDRVPEDGAPTGESYHIGRVAVSGPGHEPLVVDWRAPVAEPFYRATGLDPQGLALRRHLAVKGRKVVGLEDEYFGQGTVRGNGGGRAGTDGADELDDDLTLGGPAALLAALGEARTGRMGDIVATIQREQDEIIRSPLAGVLMVQGGPGTGKTAVALHRAAYLLYTHRFPLERQGVLVVGPNPVFLRYIEQVLPSLGETGVTLSTVAGLVPEVRVRVIEPAAIARLKGEARMARVLARAVRTRERPLRADVTVPFGATTLTLRADDSAEIVATARRRRGTHNARRRFVEQEVARRLTDQYRRYLDRGAGGGQRPAAESQSPAREGDHSDAESVQWTEVSAQADPAEVELQQPELDLAQLGRQLRGVPALAEALDRIWPRLQPHELLHDLLGAKPLLAAAGQGILSAAEQAALFRPRSGSLNDVGWTVADTALIDEARTLLGPRRTRSARSRTEAREVADRTRDGGFWPQGLDPSPSAPNGTQPQIDGEGIRSYGHIVVDEVQDLSPMQLRMIARRSLSGSMTVVGDIAQATGPWDPASWEEIAKHLTPRRAPRSVELTVSYRTPAEVIEAAAPVLGAVAPGVTPPRPVRRSGHRPEIFVAPEDALAARAADAAAAALAATVSGRTAVLAPPALLSEGADSEIVTALRKRGLDPVDPRDPGGQGLGAPLVVLPVDEANGLEFDAVVVVEPSLIAAGADPAPNGQPRNGGFSNGPEPNATAPAGNGRDGRPEPTVRGLRTLYVAMTRPTRRLAIVHSTPLPEGLVGG